LIKGLKRRAKKPQRPLTTAAAESARRTVSSASQYEALLKLALRVGLRRRSFLLHRLADNHSPQSTPSIPFEGVGLGLEKAV